MSQTRIIGRSPKGHPQKTNAARVLDAAGIPYELREYPVGAEHLDAERVASLIGMPPERVFKTLLVQTGDRRYCFAVVPSNAELDRKALARACGDRKIALVPLRELEPLTGYVRGGVTALASKKPFPTFVDTSACSFETISVSAGQRGVQVVLEPTAYMAAARAQAVPLCRQCRE